MHHPRECSFYRLAVKKILMNDPFDDLRLLFAYEKNGSSPNITLPHSPSLETALSQFPLQARQFISLKHLPLKHLPLKRLPLHRLRLPSRLLPELPTDIDFLTRHGVPAGILHGAAHHARLLNISASEAMLATGRINETAYYHALSRELGLPVLPRRAQAADTVLFPYSIHEGVAPLADNPWNISHAICPRGLMIHRLLVHRERLRNMRLAIAAPSAFRRLVMSACDDDIAHKAANGLADRLPAFSVRAGPSHRQWGALVLLATLFCTAFGYAPQTTMIASMLGAAVIFFAMAVLRIICCMESLTHPGPDQLPTKVLSDKELPVYTVIVALYREKRVLRQLIAALMALDYPAAKLDIILMLEEDDFETIGALQALSLPTRFQTVIAPPGGPRTKPRALNMALALARGELTVVYDAEDIPDAAQLRDAATLFSENPTVACLQARLVIDNARDGLLPSLFAAEYAGLFDALNPGLIGCNLPLLLGGSSNHFRTQALLNLGGWDAWNVTEDADIALRMARRGWQVADLPSATHEEAPITLGAWYRQRTRWMKGWMQVCITHSRHPLKVLQELGFLRTLSAGTLTFGTLISALGMPFYIPLSIYLLLQGFTTPMTWVQAGILGFSLTVFTSGLVASLLPPTIGLLRRGRKKLLFIVPLLPFYAVLLSAAAWSGLIELIWHPTRWNKTAHGLSRRRKLHKPPNASLPAQTRRSFPQNRPSVTRRKENSFFVTPKDGAVFQEAHNRAIPTPHRFIRQ